MVGLLIVSHSTEIARGVQALVEQMTQGQVAVAATGGTPDGAIGTSADLIGQVLEAMRASSDVDSVLVLVDLGSAVMSAEIALELSELPFVISNAPLVEGAVLAAVEASIGADLPQTAAAAEHARDLVKVKP